MDNNLDLREKFELSESELLGLFIAKMREYGKVKSGTYNEADPTHFETIKTQWIIENPDQSEYHIDVLVEDVTWVTTITFTEVESGEEMSKGIWSPSEQTWVNTNAPSFFESMYNVFINGVHQSDLDREEELSLMGFYEK